MKTVQVMFDEALLAELDKTADVREKGRSAVLRQLTSDFLRQRRKREIDAQYERAYGRVKNPLGREFDGWEEEGVWPPE
jgi:metal-responsive CopG/Arc/MetJ family transcriptional regulator